jgi:chromosome segregation ATPase
MCKSKKKKINKQIKKLPTRIDEVSRGLPDVAGLDWKEIEPEIADLKDKKQKKEQELARVENGGEIAEKKKKITEIETELQEIKNDHTAEYEEQIGKAKADLSKARDELEKLERNIKNGKRDINDFKNEIKKLEKEKEQLKQEWYDVQAEKDNLNEQSWEGDKKCTTCGQDLPEGQIEEAKAKFNREKAERIEQVAAEQTEINQQGKSIVEKIKRQHEQIEQLQHKIDQEFHDLSFKQDEIKKLEKKTKELQEQSKTFKDSDKYQLKLKEKEQLEDEIKQLKDNNKFSLQKIDKEITTLTEKIEEEQQKLNDIKAYNKGQKRIEELKAEERKLAAKYEELERQVSLCDEFTRAKVSALEDEINSHFKYTDWKLFDELVNGGIEETCEALHKGVAYNSTLNTGAKILVGVDVINTLSEHYGIRVPVFIDNYESVSKELESECQLIKLKMVEGVKKLRIEKEGA